MANNYCPNMNGYFVEPLYSERLRLLQIEPERMARQQKQRPSIIYQEYKQDMEKATNASIRCQVDFTKPDALRTDVLIVGNRSLYVNDFYLSIWSPIFRDSLFSMKVTKIKDRKELIMDDKWNFADMIQILKCIYPEQQDINDNNLTQVLPLAYEFQIDEILHRCINYIRMAQMKLIDKLILADHFRLNPLLKYCLRELRTGAQIDFQSSTYASLSDHTKVQILEKLQYSKSMPDPEVGIDDDQEMTTIVDASNFAKFTQKSEIYFSAICTKSGRHFYCNPYYLATWSRVINDQVSRCANCHNELTTTLTDDEMVNFLLAIHPPMLTLDRLNVKEVLKAACKLEANGLIRLCSKVILTPPLLELFPNLTLQHQSASLIVEMFDSLALLDACYLFDLFEPYLRRVQTQDTLVSSFIMHPKYDTLSFRAKAALLDRQASILSTTKDGSHICSKCHHQSTCRTIKWVCPHCGGYHSGSISNK